jgi:hypothetical protein
MLPILAYFDPGSGSLLVQAIVGGLAGMTVFGKYMWNAFTDRSRRLDGHSNGTDANSLAAASSGEIPIGPQ